MVALISFYLSNDNRHSFLFASSQSRPPVSGASDAEIRSLVVAPVSWQYLLLISHDSE